MKYNYSFDELELLKGYSVVAAGETDIDYTIADAEPDVGIFEPWVSDLEITSIVVYPYSKNGPALNLSQDHWLYKLIYDALMDDTEYLQRICAEDAADNYGRDD